MFALKQAYRDVLLEHVRAPRVVYLELSRAEAERRLEQRRGQHAIVGDFARMLDGQYRDLEPPTTRSACRRSSVRRQIVERAARTSSRVS